LERKLAAILAADVVGFSRLIGDNEEATIATLNSHRQVIDRQIENRRGRVFGTAGDSVIAEFSSPVEALRCAVEMQQGIEERNNELPENHRMRFRVGVNLGDVMIVGDDLLGDGVNIAARLEGIAKPGGICISGTMFDQVEGKLDLAMSDLGTRQVKNIAKPLRVYSVSVDEPRVVAAAHSGEAPPLPDKPSIAVLPFDNMSGDPEQEYFSDGISEDIITDLSKVSGLYVASRYSAFVFKNAKVKIQQIATDLAVRFVLEGSVRKAGNSVRITAQLIDGSTGDHVWAERYDRELTNIFEVQDDIASSIVGALKVRILPSEERAIEKRQTINIDAYEYFLRGRQLLREMTRDRIELAEHMFREAIDQDAEYALAYAGLADCASVLVTHYDKDASVLEGAVRNSRKALELDPNSAEVHASRGRVLTLRGDHKLAADEFQIAIQIDPDLYEAHYYWGQEAMETGKLDEAATHMRRALEIGGNDLQSAMMTLSLVRGAGSESDIWNAAHRAFEIAERRLELNPADQGAHYVGANALIGMGDTGRANEWARMAAAIETTESRTNYNLACMFSLLGDTDNAIAHLERSIKEGVSDSKLEWMKQDPDLKSARQDPRVRELLRSRD